MVELRCQYEALLDEAFEALGESNADLMSELATNDKRNKWIESVDSKLEEFAVDERQPRKERNRPNRSAETGHRP